MIFPFVFKADTNPNFTKDVHQLLDLVDQLNKNKVLCQQWHKVWMYQSPQQQPGNKDGVSAEQRPRVPGCFSIQAVANSEVVATGQRSLGTYQ